MIVGFLSCSSVTSVLATNPYNPLAVKRALGRQRAVQEAFSRRADHAALNTVSPERRRFAQSPSM